MRSLLIILGIIATAAAAVAVFILAVWILVWNLTDIQNVGFNFWNVFWIALTTTALFGGTNKALS